MPYTGGNDPNLPAGVKKLPAKKRRQWSDVWNSVYKRTHDEGRAFAGANSVVARKQTSEVDMAKSVPIGAGDKARSVTLYDGANDSALPAHVKALPRAVRSQWVYHHTNYATVSKDNEAAHDAADAQTMMSISELNDMGMLGGSKEQSKPVEPDDDDDEAGEAGAKGMPETAGGVVRDPDKGSSAAVQAGILQRLRTLLLGGKGDDAAQAGTALGQATTPGVVTVYKGTDGRMRVLAVYSNVFKDKEREIFSTASHEEYADAAESGQAAYPDLHLWHGGPATRWGSVETVSFVNGFSVAGGVVDPGKEHVALKIKELADKGELAVSFGYIGLRGPDGVYALYRPFEISPLPVGSEANPWTSIDLTQADKESDMAFSDRKKSWFKEHFQMSDTDIDAAEKKFESMSAALKAVGVEWKEAGELPVVAPVAPVATPPAPVVAPVVTPVGVPDGDYVMPQLTAMADAVKELAVSIKAVNEQLAAYKQADANTVEQRAQDQIMAKIVNGGGPGGAGYRPSAADTNVVGAKQSGEEWLEEAIGSIFQQVEQQAGAVSVGHTGGVSK